jgi:L-alanine-DL-glutamate epimerase-like enolase superfamily enzyme
VKKLTARAVAAVYDRRTPLFSNPAVIDRRYSTFFSQLRTPVPRPFMWRPSMKITDRFVPLVGNARPVQNGKLGLPPGPGLGVELRPELLTGDRVRIESVA